MLFTAKYMGMLDGAKTLDHIQVKHSRAVVGELVTLLNRNFL